MESDSGAVADPQDRAIWYFWGLMVVLAIGWALFRGTGFSVFPSEAEEAVRLDMLDPDAAQFRYVEQCKADDVVWHGEVNGKNAYGAYTGFKSFYYSGHSVAYAGDDAFLPLMHRCYGTTEEEVTRENAGDDPVVADAKRALRELNKAEAARDAALAMPSADDSPTKKTFPYVAPDGVDILNAQDERNWQKYGTTTPDGGD